MRKLEDVLSAYHDYSKRDILFEDGEWCLYRRVGDRCYIIHRCGKVNRAQDPEADRCHGCNEKAPVELKGLFILNEWKR